MRPIDAKEYSDRLIWMIKYGTYQGVEDALLDALYKLTEMPTITMDDMRPKGRWAGNYPYAPRCSNCKRPADELFSGRSQPVCLHCLAKMERG